MSMLRVASISLVLIFGCAVDDAVSTTDVEQLIPVLGGGCDDFGCGLNSPEIDHLGIHDLHGQVGGKRNANGFFIAKIEQTRCTPFCTTKYYDKLFSKYGVLTASGPSGAITGSAVKGLVIRVGNAVTGAKYVITIADVGKLVPMWAQKAGTEMWPQYIFQWDQQRPPGSKQEWKAVCKNPPSDNSGDLMGMNAFHSLVFENDEIEARSKTVKGLRSEENWFNIGCAGHTIAKLQLIGMTSAAEAKFGFVASWDTRTAAIKMLSNDICGTGFAFTIAGQPLQWMDKKLWNEYQPIAIEKEAIWTHKGAACMNKTRILANPTPLGTATFPTIMDDIKAECGGTPPPACADVDPYNLESEFFVSSNPL